MPINDIACHVFAIDGYQNDATAATVNAAYANSIPPPPRRAASAKAPTQAALREIVTQVREAAGTQLVAGTQVILYGGYRRGQVAPEHMWFEYEGRIYETMPGEPVRSQEATAASRQQTYLERNNDAFDYVISLQTQLTTRQQAHVG